MLISPAYAQGAGGGMGGLEPLIPLVLIFVVFYFLLIRPQQKKAKQHRELLSALRRGDRVVTSGGLIGTITRVINDAEISVEIAPDIKVRVMRAMVAEVLTKGAAPDDDDDRGESDPPREQNKPRRRKKTDDSDD